MLQISYVFFNWFDAFSNTFVILIRIPPKYKYFCTINDNYYRNIKHNIIIYYFLKCNKVTTLFYTIYSAYFHTVF